jgi:hypothetical protein
MPLIVGAVVVVAIAGAVLQRESPEKSVSSSPAGRTTPAAAP